MFKFSAIPMLLASFMLAAATNSHAQTGTTPDAPAAQAALPLEPGLWQVNTRPEMVGGQMMVLPRNTRMCVTSEDVQAGRIPVVSMPACQVQEGGTWEGNKLTLKLACRGLPEQAQQRGTIQAQGTSFQGQVEVILAPDKEGMERSHMVYHQVGTRVAAQCPAPKAPGASQPRP